MKIKVYYPVFLAVLLMCGARGIGQNASDSSLALANSAYRSLTRAGTLNGISLGLGVASNIEMVFLKGFPLGYEEGLNPTANLSHMVLGVSRLTFSIFPPIKIAKARKALKPWRESPEMAPSCRRLFRSMDAAEVLTAVAPVLCLAGGIMMGMAANKEKIDSYPNSPTKNTTWKTVGWICIGTGLAATITATIMIADAKKELSRKIGTLKMTASPSGIGLLYNLPTKQGNRR